MKNKKVVWIVIGIVSVALIALAITYAYWQITASQQGVNEISAACLDITLVDAESGNTGVTLQDQYPLSDTEGAALKPYKFTVTNNCDKEVYYQIALESIGDSTTALKAKSLKVKLNDNNANLLSDKPKVDPIISGAYASHKLGTGTLAKSGDDGSSATHEVRLWIDKDAPVEENNKTFIGKISVTIGQNIVNPIKEGTLAYSLVNAYGGEGNITEIDVNKKSTEMVSSAAGGSTYISSGMHSWGTEYMVDEETGYYTLAGTIVQSTVSDCVNGVNDCGKYIILDNGKTIPSSYRLNEVVLMTEDVFRTNTYQYVNEFYFPTQEDYKEMHKVEDDYGVSYYYRGNVTNNYVKFGKYSDDYALTYTSGYSGYGCNYPLDENGYPTGGEATLCDDPIIFDTEAECSDKLSGYDTYYCEPIKENAAGKPIYWRVVRVNGDGTIRLIYDGPKALNSSAEKLSVIGVSSYNNLDRYDIKHVGYVYGDNNSSTIKAMVDAWYENNLEEDYEKYIADNIFCNDREIARTLETETGTISFFAASNRLVDQSNRTPKLICTRDEDKLTVSKGTMTHPIGLITADEVVMAGGAHNRYNYTYYLSGGSEFLTMTPSTHGILSGDSDNLGDGSHVFKSGYSLYDHQWIDLESGVRPVINLKADVEFEYEETENGLGIYTILTD